MSCTYALCDDWTWDGDDSCWKGLKNEYKNTCSNNSSHGTPVLGGFGCNISSYRLSGCGSKEVLGYYGTNHTGDFTAFRGRSGDLRNNDLRSVRIRDIPDYNSGRIRANTDSECPGIDERHVYHRTEGKKRSCFYDKSWPNEIRTVFNSKSGNRQMSSLFTDLKTMFCGQADNVFKNPGGGICLDYDEGKRLAKAYCKVSNRIATDANCTKDNLGNHYEEVAEAYCKTHDGKHNQWCSCYNVSKDVCKTHSTAAGCKKKRDTYDKLVEATPKDYKNSWNGMATCFGGVCTGKKYIPANSNQNCNRPVQVCVQDFDIQGIADSTINATCEQTANTNTQPSAGDSPSGVSPSGGSPSGGSPSGATPLDRNAQSRATSAFGNLTDTQKKAAVGLTALFLFLIFVLIIF